MRECVCFGSYQSLSRNCEDKAMSHNEKSSRGGGEGKDFGKSKKTNESRCFLKIKVNGDVHCDQSHTVCHVSAFL